MTTAEEVLAELRKLADPAIIKSQEKFGISTGTSLGLSVPQIRTIAKRIGINHTLALDLWKTKVHEARHVASMIADPSKLSEKLMESWLKDFNSWDIVDGCCSSYFRYSPAAYEKAVEWTTRKKEFERL